MVWFSALYGLVGLIVGSFLNVVMDRLPAQQSLLRPPSHCPQCGRQLTAGDLVPVVSYLVLRGRCRTCGARIPLRVLLVELVTGLLFAFLAWFFGPSVELALSTVYTCFLLVILVIDLEHKLVLNVVILPAIVLALLAIPIQALVAEPSFAHLGLFWLIQRNRGMASLSIAQWTALSQLLGGLAAFLIFWLIWLIAPQGMGAGDVKLAAFAGLITAFPGALVAVFSSFILGGVVGVVLLITRLAGRKTAIPFAPFLVLTTFLYMLYGSRLLLWYFAG